MIKKIDHFVITTEKPKECIEFYKKLGFTSQDAGGRYELFAGDFKINVHIQGQELLPHAQNIQVGSADFCFEVTDSIEELYKQLKLKNIDIELGIVERHGVQGKMKSIYLRDPDMNLIEFCSYQ